MEANDPYALTADKVQEPPVSFWGSLRYLGPGFILSASIVGSGELIATTILGQKAGFILLWVILVSCLVKVCLQLEFGRHAINTGETTMAALSRMPGPCFGRGHWSIWVWLSLMVFKFLQVGGIVGVVAIVCNIAVPGLGVAAWCWVLAVGVALLVFRGYYRFIERVSLVMIGVFALFTLASVVMLQFTEYAVSLGDVASGLTFQFPDALIFVAIAAFGITGVGGDEIMFYTYWLLEKGYAAKVGPNDGSEAWARRARGWTRVMYADALLSMLVYTVMTAAFYLLGAAVLHAGGGEMTDKELIPTLSTIYTESLGPWAKNVFLAGAFIVLFSTLFAALASWTRIFSDAFSRVGLFEWEDLAARRRWIARLAWFFPLAWAAIYLGLKGVMAGATMVLVGGFVTSIILLLVVFAAIHFRFVRLLGWKMGEIFYDFAFWVSAVAIALVGVKSVVDKLPKAEDEPEPAPEVQPAESAASVRG